MNKTTIRHSCCNCQTAIDKKVYQYSLAHFEYALCVTYTQSCLKGVWANYLPMSLGFDEFNNESAPVIMKMNYLVDVFPVNSKAAFVVTLDEFLHDLNMELDKY